MIAGMQNLNNWIRIVLWLSKKTLSLDIAINFTIKK